MNDNQFIRLGKKEYTVKEWKKFDYPHQSVLLRKFDIVLSDHQTKKEKFNSMFDRIFKADIDKALTKVTRHLDDFHNMMDNMKGIGGKQKDLSGLLSSQKKGKLSL